jgi:hypothetical protein
MRMVIVNMSNFTLGVFAAAVVGDTPVETKRITNTHFLAKEIADFAKAHDAEKIVVAGNEMFVQRYITDIEKESNIKTTFTKGGL